MRHLYTAYDVGSPRWVTSLFDMIDGADNYGPNSEIAENEARFFSRTNDYANRASAEANIAVAPDRGDFGKFGETYDVFYGSYSALVDNNPGDNGGYNDESDMFFYADTDGQAPMAAVAARRTSRAALEVFRRIHSVLLAQTGCRRNLL